MLMLKSDEGEEGEGEKCCVLDADSGLWNQ